MSTATENLTSHQPSTTPTPLSQPGWQSERVGSFHLSTLGVDVQPLALVRTYVPIAIGALVTFLATLGVHVDGTTQTALVIGLTGLASAVYYTLAHWLESRWPVFSVLLGANATPSYVTASTGSAGPVLAGQSPNAPNGTGL